MTRRSTAHGLAAGTDVPAVQSEMSSVPEVTADGERLPGRKTEPIVHVSAAGADTALLSGRTHGVEGEKPDTNVRGKKTGGRRRTRLWLRRFFRGSPRELPKVAVDRSFLAAVGQTMVHVIPIGTTIVLAYLNLGGKFIGEELGAISGEAAQSVDILCLQVAAKLMELFTVGSLVQIVFTIVHRELIFQDGLPLGLVNSPFKFTDLTYFASPGFWSWRTFAVSYRKRFLIVSTIVLAGAIAAFAGPVSALLLIPEMRTDWPGGETTFWLSGLDSDLWPTTLDENHVGGSECLNPTMDMLNLAAPNTTGCIWAGAAQLSTYYRASRMTFVDSITLYDNIISRILAVVLSDWVGGQVATWAMATHLASAAAANSIVGAWWSASKGMTDFKYGGVKYSSRKGGTVTVNLQIPAVRAACSVYPMDSNWFSDETYTQLEFPYLPEYDVQNGTAYWMSQLSLPNSTRLATWWYPIPSGNSTLSSSGVTDWYPSAFLFVQIPSGDDTPDAGYVCTIDGRWAPGSTVLSGVPQGFSAANPAITNSRPRNMSFEGSDRDFLPIDDGSWKAVRFTDTWLNTLSPNASDSDPGYTSLAATLSAAGFDNSTGLTEDIFGNGVPIAGVLATYFAEAMSRIGYATNKNPLIWNDAANIILGGEQAIQQPPGDQTALKWSIAITGYAYGANEVAQYLALAVLFIHLVMAVAHSIYLLSTRRVTRAWRSLEDLMVLSHESPPSREALDNTCAGIETHATMKQVMRIRARQAGGVKDDGEQVHLLADDGGDDAACERIVIGREYGAVADGPEHKGQIGA